jgi:hypothetical protein
MVGRMGVSFKPGDLVRYSENGERGAMRGLVGIVVEPSNLGREKGWVRVGFGAQYDDFSNSELETPLFWAVSTMHPVTWEGPFSNWHDAISALVDLIFDRSVVERDTPLAYKRDQAISTLQHSKANLGGTLVHLVPGGEFRVILAGQNQPSLFDKLGRRYA